MQRSPRRGVQWQVRGDAAAKSDRPSGEPSCGGPGGRPPGPHGRFDVDLDRGHLLQTCPGRSRPAHLLTRALGTADWKQGHSARRPASNRRIRARSALRLECLLDPLDVLGAVAPPIVFGVDHLRDVELFGDSRDAVDGNPHLHSDVFGREVALGNRHGRSSIMGVDYAACECLDVSVLDTKLQVNCVQEESFKYLTDDSRLGTMYTCCLRGRT